MNLEELNLVELNSQEQQEVEGGFLPLLAVGALLLLTSCVPCPADK
ncbi:hypothetical protein SAMN06265349_102192 [Flavobacterium resistens]|uniref:Class IIb bacteriocin, lactobin A/cerein 7B family n=1 Tax=Flavobacterium resistens TaxID=443612 RepID=A0A521C4V7_9FLAO|nr:class IIb bacteriocin, lactobin A/cerein 7B family [Flavobacterium resistens]MRX69593.1 class IIb bacteriocin, lactobin A/cerein 7B family [Flavobacterium resistens]SMO54365.1 hypothetical protein SAMN06265349_102192 [Flavobacterium resistens]